MFLYHYFERAFGPFRPLTALPIEEAREILTRSRKAGHFQNPDIEGFLAKRYDRDKNMRELFIERGGRPQRANPIYFFLGEHCQWKSAYDDPAVIKIPMSEFDLLTVSYTYGDSFAIFDPACFGAEEYWNKLYFAGEILGVIERNGLPPYVEYDFNRGIYPTDKHINRHLKAVEAHVWDDEVLDRYRGEWAAGNTTL
jgi:hypothetical protein